MTINSAIELANIHKFFLLAKERELIRKQKVSGMPKPWTEDPIFAAHRFCNVSREDDRTTAWFRENIRNKVCNEPEEALAAIVAFRWFNKIETGEKIKPFILGDWDNVKVYNTLAAVKPVVTGAYIIKTPDGMNKLKGVLWCIEEFLKRLKAGKFDRMLSGQISMEESQRLLEQSPYLGRFMAYQIIADARYTCMLEEAPDINTWAQPGPGSTRGIGRVFYNDPLKFRYGSPTDEKEVIVLMKKLLDIAHGNSFKDIVPELEHGWEMQTIQNWNCEYDKHVRCEEGGKMKRKYP